MSKEEVKNKQQEDLEQCVHLEMARSQRATELARGQGESGTGNYARIGCYKCDGHKKECQSYYKNKEVEGK